MGRGIVIALALSLAANVFLGGFVAGRMAGGPHHRDGAPAFSMRRDGPDGFSDLTPAARDSLRRAFKARRAASREQFRAARELHEEFVDILSADVYDRAAAEALAAKFEAADNFAAASGASAPAALRAAIDWAVSSPALGFMRSGCVRMRY